MLSIYVRKCLQRKITTQSYQRTILQSQIIVKKNHKLLHTFKFLPLCNDFLMITVRCIYLELE